MNLKTENLAILLTDIAGFSAATASQSRRDNAALLAAHNRILLPVVRRYKGRHVKSIGDALLIVFRSPTDAMLCAMAMQDTLHEYNRSVPEPQQIRIRIAASLGEVRVTRNDIFGEPVNITHRIEEITPADEIWFSEAVYMAMNKAEVPSAEVGWRELKGVSGAIRVFHIPRFATHRLVAQDILEAEDVSDLVYPFGGAHLARDTNDTRRAHAAPAPWLRRAAFGAAASLLLMGVAAAVVYEGWAWRTGPSETPPPRVPAEPVAVQEPARPARAPAPAANPPRYSQGFAPLSRSAPAGETASSASPVDAGGGFAPLVKPVDRIAGFDAAKRAYRAEKISKTEYREVVTRLKAAREREEDEAKRLYKAGRLDKSGYRDRIREIHGRYQ